MLAQLDDQSPLAPQLVHLNEACVKLANANMRVSDIQYSLILLNTLPKSYKVVASTLLASGLATSLKYSEITARILNEEGRKSGPTASLNLASAPVKTSKKKNKDHSNLICHYCKFKGHIQLNCQKKKKDEAAEKKRKEEESKAESSKKAANLHVLIPTTASIEEVNESEMEFALYTVKCEHWMMDSGVTHPFKSDFADYAPCQGAVSLGDKSSVKQIGVGSVLFKTSQGTQLTWTSVLHIPELKTCFLSTRVLVQRGATVLFDQGPFKSLLMSNALHEGIWKTTYIGWMLPRPLSMHIHDMQMFLYTSSINAWDICPIWHSKCMVPLPLLVWTLTAQLQPFQTHAMVASRANQPVSPSLGLERK